MIAPVTVSLPRSAIKDFKRFADLIYTVRSERLLMEELVYNLLFRWFVGLNMDDPVWHPTTLTKNRYRLLPRLMTGEITV